MMQSFPGPKNHIMQGPGVQWGLKLSDLKLNGCQLGPKALELNKFYYIVEIKNFSIE